MKTGMSTACFFGRVYNEQALKEMAKLGIRDAEIFFSAHMEYGKEYVRELSEICDGEGICIRSVHALPTQFEPQLFSSHQRQFEEAMGIYREVLAAARTLSAGIYVFHGPMRVKIAKNIPINFDLAGGRATMLAEEAKQYGVRLCYETVHWCWYRYPGFAKELLAHSDSDNIYFTLDMKQAAQSGYDVLSYIDDMGSRLAHVHVCDFMHDEEKGVIPCMPFAGEADWQGIRHKLNAIGYDGMLMLEVYASDYAAYAELQKNYERVRQFFAVP